MRTQNIALSGLLLCLPLGTLVLTGTGCAGTRYQRSTGAYVDDKALTAKAKTALFKDPEVSGFDVHINTFRGEVQLSGFVDTPSQKERAASVVREIPGVQLVVNNLEVKPAQKETTAVGAPGTNVEGSSRTVTSPAPETPAADLRPNPSPGRGPSEVPPPAPPRPERSDLVPAPLDRTVAPEPPPKGASSADALDTRAARDLAGLHDVKIEVSHGKATIRGNVGSPAERDDLQRRVSEIPGVESVDNRLEVRRPAPVRE